MTPSNVTPQETFSKISNRACKTPKARRVVRAGDGNELGRRARGHGRAAYAVISCPDQANWRAEGRGILFTVIPAAGMPSHPRQNVLMKI